MASSAERLHKYSFWESDMMMFLKVEVDQGIEHEVEQIIIHHGNKVTAHNVHIRELPRLKAAVYNVLRNAWTTIVMCSNGESIMYKESIVPYQTNFGMVSQLLQETVDYQRKRRHSLPF